MDVTAGFPPPCPRPDKGTISPALSKCYIGAPERQGLTFACAGFNTHHMAPLLGRMAEILRKV